MMRNIRTVLAAAVLALPLALTAQPAEAAPHPGCNPWQYSDARHTVAVHCDMPVVGTTQYAIAVYFCGSTGCWYGIGNYKNWGAPGKSTAHSDYGTANSVGITFR